MLKDKLYKIKSYGKINETWRKGFKDIFTEFSEMEDTTKYYHLPQSSMTMSLASHQYFKLQVSTVKMKSLV